MKIDEYIKQELSIQHDGTFTHSYTPNKIGYIKCLETIDKAIKSGFIEV